MIHPMVSCLCVTRQRVALLRRAVACFFSQTHPSRELIVVYESDDVATKLYIQGIHHVMMRSIEVSCEPRQPLGTLRNIAMQASKGRFVAQWDDDDWYSPRRLAAQIEALTLSNKPACVLSRWILYDEYTQKAYISGSRAWEGSLVCERAVAPTYSPRRKGEDTEAVALMGRAGLLAGLNSPRLYIYVQHDKNTWGRTHWETNILPFAKVLPPELAASIKSVLAPKAS